MLRNFSLYDLYVLSFAQLIFSTVLVLSPAREIGIRFRWTGSRITEVLVGSVGAIAISAIACVLTQALWGLPIAGLEVAALPLVIVSVVVIALQPDRNVIGHIFYASFASAFLTSVAYAAYLAVVASHSILEAVTASFVILLDVGALVVWISYINYQSDVLCRSRRGRPLPVADPGYQPMVSIHIPAYNEPPELLIETIKAAEAIDYPDFEVVVMDNNTKDPAVWQPVEDYCRDRDRVKFVHVAPWPGYKAGACNLALRRYTDPRAEVIGLVDADDLVQPHYLRETVPYFSDPRLGFVQTFEGNREFEGSPYYTACVDSYQAFYLSNMSARTERDSVPFVGTMGLFRRSALTAIGGWNEWCISEDTEASLRVLKDGWSGLYIPRCFGRGVVPPSFAGMLTQRHRWCFGGMQILRLHWRSLMPWDRSPDNHLTAAQRRDYLMASLGWFRDLLMLIFSLLLLVITGLLVTDSGFAVAPMVGSWSVLPVSLIIIATFCMMWTLRHWTTMSYRRALLSLVISLAVAWVVALGCIEGIARRERGLPAHRQGGRPAHHLHRDAAGPGGDDPGRRPVRLRRPAGRPAAPAVAAHRHRLVPGHRVHLRPDRSDVEPAGAGGPWPGVPAPFRRAPGAHRAPPPGCLGALPTACRRGADRAVRRRGDQCLRLSRVAAAHDRHGDAGCRGGGGASGGTQVYVKLGSSGAGTYYPVTSAHLSDRTLSFDTSSLLLLGEVLQAAADGGHISQVSLAFRAPGTGGHPAAETFSAAVVTSLEEHLSGAPSGSVSLLLPRGPQRRRGWYAAGCRAVFWPAGVWACQGGCDHGAGRAVVCGDGGHHLPGGIGCAARAQLYHVGAAAA